MLRRVETLFSNLQHKRKEITSFYTHKRSNASHALVCP